MNEQAAEPLGRIADFLLLVTFVTSPAARSDDAASARCSLGAQLPRTPTPTRARARTAPTTLARPAILLDDENL